MFECVVENDILNVLRSDAPPSLLQNLVDVSLAAPLHDPAVCLLPLDLASSILTVPS